MTRRYLLALGLVALLSIAAFSSLQWVIQAQEAHATLVNVSGRQRMLSQRTALFAVRLVQEGKEADRAAIRATLGEAAELMLASHEGLTRGSAAMGLPARMSEAVRAMYFDPPLRLDAQVRRYLGHVMALVERPDGSLAADDPDLAYILAEGPHRLLPSLDAMVRRYETEAKAEVAKLERIEAMVLGLTLTMLVLEALFIFRPMVRQVETETGKLLATQHQLEHLARHDPLTGLFNRAMLGDRVQQALAATRRTDEWLAVLCLDLDRFKEVNDSLGHPVGDELLRRVAERLLAHVREADTVARLGGDEFAIVQAGLRRPEMASALARRLIEALAAPFALGEHETVIGASIGIAVAPQDGDSADLLLKKADIALYRAKAEGRGTFRFFEPEMDARLKARCGLERDLRQALPAGQLELHYQPQVVLGRNEIIGFEALLRWRHPSLGMVSPLRFIPLAEETGLIFPIGEWVLRRACADAALWPRPVRLAVNISPAQFRHADLVGLVAEALRQTGLAPDRLELEITERIVMHETETVLATLRRLKELGVRIAMDDFGTGYSSLGYLRRFPFDKIKIDQSFIQGLEDSRDALAIVRAIIGLGRSLDMEITAEGVETQGQATGLKAEGCGVIQGFYSGRPMPLHEVVQALGADRPSVGSGIGKAAPTTAATPGS